MPLATPSRHSTRAYAKRATRALLDRCAAPASWLEPDLRAGQSGLRAKATLWAHGKEPLIQWEATTPLTVYTVLLLLDDARLSLRSDTHEVAECDCTAGSYYVSRPGEAISVRCAGPCRALHVAAPVQLFWSGTEADHACFSLAPSRDALLLQLARTLLAVPGDIGEGPLGTQVMELFVDRLRDLRAEAAPRTAACRRTALPNWRLQRVDDYLKAHLSEPITLNDMAAAAGLSPMHFAAQFRTTTGYRPHHYLLLCRMEQAKRLIAEAPHSMLDIALEVGFHTQSHFTTVFKRLTGKTPRQWRDETRRPRLS